MIPDEQPQPTQVAHPGKATARTVVQGLIGLVVVVAALQADGTLPQNLPWIGGALAVTAIAARVMAHPRVNDWLRSVGLNADV